MKSILAVLLTVLLLPGATPESAQPQNRSRPKLGVALAGGAALGLAHVGVLQWMEEHRIPIDYIAGTSMGGLVGGLYATGYTSSEMGEFMSRVNWEVALSSTAPYRDQAFRRKEDSSDFPTPFEIGLKNRKVAMPSGLSAGEGVALVIDRFAAPYANLASFNDLPTPFRCVASNLSAGKGVVFEKGSLFDALRATMSLPALFSPFHMNGMLLVDGALTNNLPVNVVKGMGADYTIAVALDLPVNPDDFKSLLGVAGRSISYMISENERPQIASADLVLMPLLKGMTNTDYSKWDKFREIGYAAAEQKSAMLRQFQVSEAEYRQYQEARRAKRRPNQIRPQEIRISGDVAPNMQEALKRAIMPPPGEPVDQKAMESQMMKLAGAGRFETATYEFLREDNKEVLSVKVRERPEGPPFLRPSLFIDGASGDGIRLGFGARLSFYDLGGPASEWRTDASVGTYNKLSSEYYHRFKGGKWFIAPRAGISQDQLPIYDTRGTRLSEYNRTGYSGAADLGYSFGRFSEMRFGYELGYLDTTLQSGTTGQSQLIGSYGQSRLMYRRDTRDNPYVALSGFFLEGSASWFNRYPGMNRQFASFEGHYTVAHSFNPLYSMSADFAGGNAVQGTTTRSMFDLGGYNRLSALSRFQLLGNNFYYGNLMVRRALSVDSVSLFGKFYGAIGYEAGRAWYPGLNAKPRHDGLVGLLGITPFGTIFFGGSVGDQGDMKLLFRLGRRF